MAKYDDSDSPIRGFELVHYPNGLYLRCRVIGYCPFYQKIPRNPYLEEVMKRAAAHRVECTGRIQAASSIADLPFEVVPRGNRFAPVEELYHLWVKAGGPPLGININRWWDSKLIELGRLIRKD